MRNGFVLLELLAVLCLIGVLSVIAVPRLVTLVDAAALRAETVRLVAAIDAARGVAARFDAMATLELSGVDYAVRTVVTGDTLTAWQSSSAMTAGVTLTGMGAGISFSATGLASGVANRTLILTRGAAERRVVISRLGRVTY